MAAWRHVIDYRKMKLSKLPQVTLVTHSRLSTEHVLEYGAEIVILATGSHWAKDGWNRIDRVPLPGADAELPYVLTPDQIMVEHKPIAGERVLIYDCEGYFMGATLADKLAREGYKVRLVTPFPGTGPAMDFTGENLFLIPQLHRLGVELIPSHLVREIREKSVIGFWSLTPDVPVEWPVEPT